MSVFSSIFTTGIFPLLGLALFLGGAGTATYLPFLAHQDDLVLEFS